MNCPDGSPRIGRVSVQDRAAALNLVFRHLDPEDRRRQAREALAHVSPPGMGPLDGLVGAWRGHRLVGAILSQVGPGKGAALWLPRLVPDEPRSTATQLYAATWKSFHHYGIVIAKVLLPKVSETDLAMLRLGHLHHLTNLLYLSDAECEISKAASTCPIDFESCRGDDHPRWMQVVEATCAGTLDCAGLKDGRTADDILAEYRSIGVFDPGLWWIARHEERDVGCVLLADHPRHNSMELLYLGLVPEVRGRGWGRLLARHAQAATGKAGRRRLILAVDAANRPAVQTYMAVGFRALQRRRLYVRHLPSANDWHTSSEQVFHPDARNVGADSSVAGRQT